MGRMQWTCDEPGSNIVSDEEEQLCTASGFLPQPVTKLCDWSPVADSKDDTTSPLETLFKRGRALTHRPRRWMTTNAPFVALVLLVVWMVGIVYSSVYTATAHAEAIVTVDLLEKDVRGSKLQRALWKSTEEMLLMAAATDTSLCIHAKELAIAEDAAMLRADHRSTGIVMFDFRSHPCDGANPARVRHRSVHCVHEMETNEFYTCVDVVYRSATTGPNTMRLQGKKALCVQHMEMISAGYSSGATILIKPISMHYMNCESRCIAISRASLCRACWYLP